MTEEQGRLAHAELEAAEHAAAEHARLSARLERSTKAVEQAEAELQQARAVLGQEAADVERLESFSPTRIWAALRGSHATDLERERAERQAAGYAVASAAAHLGQAEAEEASVRSLLGELGDVAARRDRALSAKEAWIRDTGGAAAEELVQIARELGTVRSERAEVAEADAAGRRAWVALGAAAEKLAAARSWSTADTYFGGGLLTDLAKYNRLDEATACIREADDALRMLDRELADLGQAGLGGLGITDLTRALDVWFDNIFSDWSVRNRIGEAAERVADAQRVVADIGARLAARAGVLDQRAAQLASRREELLA